MIIEEKSAGSGMEIHPVQGDQTAPKGTGATNAQGSLRVNVNLLDKLMTLAGELVLSRNQLIQGINSSNGKAAELSSQRIDMITSDLQETIMRTRMQPIANVFTRFTRVVRDLSREMGKSVDLVVRGKEVELDKAVMETLTEPLTHLVRNAVKQGIESAPERKRAGKPPAGTICLEAFHDAGQINIVVSDDGKGLAPENMDLVMTCLEKLGGIIDIDATPGRGTEIRLKLPLTLAIIPSQIVTIAKEAYAIPQVNLDELLRIPPARVKTMVEKVGDGNVVRLRGELLPLVGLSAILGADSTSATTLNIAVVSAGAFKYGLVVDELHDSEEIVVKPLGRHMNHCTGYAGATIMGNGKVALILDISNLAQMAGLSTRTETNEEAAEMDTTGEETPLLLFRNADSEHFAVPLELVERIERIPASTMEHVGGKNVVQYRGGALPLYELSQVINVEPLGPRERYEAIVFNLSGRDFGLLASSPLDVVSVFRKADDNATLRQPGIQGAMTIEGHTTLLIDIFALAKKAEARAEITG
ncbi:MAG: hypothetical protein GY737_00420 [Desulfobacteraceae bacterium]|nr:hypothetical protein [Desulfobacteraceae bacterium]